MMTVLSMLLGGVGSVLPKLFGFLQDKTDKAHELALMDKQLEIQKATGAMHLEEVKFSADSAEMVARINAQAVVTGVKWADALSATVRPIITYGFFLLFALVTIVRMYFAYSLYRDGTVDIAAALTMFWDADTVAMFGAILAFWFGDRAINKRR